jgi:3-oxoadipate enol-lactonase
MAHETINGITLHFHVEGPEDGTPILFSNSLASNLGMWDPQVEPLCREGFKVIRYDSRGHGKSDAPEGAYSIEMLADDAAGLLDHLNIAAAHYCGLSKGGMVGQMLGIRHPDRMKTLTLADTAAFMPAKDTWEQRIATVRDGGMESVVDGTLDRWFTAPGQKRIPGEIAKVREMILSTPPTGFIGCCKAIMAMDMRPTNPSINKPTLVICGEEDSGTTPAQAKEIADAIPGASLELIPSAAHLANIEQPAAFTKALLKLVMENR